VDNVELKSQIEKLGQEIDAKIVKANGQAAEAGTIANETKNEVKGMSAKFAELSEQLDSIEAAQTRMEKGRSMEAQESLEALLTKSADYKAFAELKGRGDFRMDVKATLLKPGVNAGAVIAPDRTNGLFMQPLTSLRMRDILASGTTNSDTIYSMYEDYYTSNAAFVKEGEIKPEDDFKLKSEVVPVKTLATLIRVSNQMLADIPYISTYITTRGAAKMDLKLDDQILFGSGIEEDIKGLTLYAQTFKKPVGLKVTSANSYDALVAAMLQVRIAEYGTSAIVMHPIDITNMMLEKNAGGAYLFPGLQGGARNINGVPVVENTNPKLVGKYLVGDYKLGAALIQKEGLRIERFDQDRDNVQRNLTTFRLEQRVALPVYVPQVFVFGDIEGTKTALSAA
jgi:HK97 family phage major capsid protein